MSIESSEALAIAPTPAAGKDRVFPRLTRHQLERIAGWLEGCLTLDANGFIKTGTALTPEDLAAAGWSLARRPFSLETTLPGVFAVGDVRSGNYKRVAAAVGEGSTAIASVHQVLAS
jgi:thioredoxin reductase